MDHPRIVFISLMVVATACSRHVAEGTPALTADQAWVASACAAGSPDSKGWPRYRLGDITIAVPREYRVSEGVEYSLRFRGPHGSLMLTLHRNARYLFDDMNSARRGQNWCRAGYSGFQAEVLAWKEGFLFSNLARIEATWGGQDVGKWLFAHVSASRLADATMLRDALHTIEVVRDTLR